MQPEPVPQPTQHLATNVAAARSDAELSQFLAENKDKTVEFLLSVVKRLVIVICLYFPLPSHERHHAQNDPLIYNADSSNLQISEYSGNADCELSVNLCKEDKIRESRVL